MRIGLNWLYLIPGVVGGTEVYARRLLEALASEETGAEYVIFHNRETSFEPETNGRVRYVRCEVSGRSRGARYAYEQGVLPALARREGIEVLHSLGYVGPVYAPCAHVVTVHDLNFLQPRVSMGGLRRLGLGLTCELSARRADAVVAVSCYTRDEMKKRWGFSGDRIYTVHSGPGNAGEYLPFAHNGKLKYLLALTGGGMPHKNIEGLLEAYRRILGQIEHRLVLVGRLSERAQLMLGGDKALREKVSVVNRASDAEVREIVAGADVFVVPSRYEGFGFPVLESQARGTAVLCSRCGSLPEIAGDGAVYFDVEDIGNFTSQLLACATDEGLKERLRLRGATNLERFSWQRCARETLAVYRAAERRRRRGRGELDESGQGAGRHTF